MIFFNLKYIYSSDGTHVTVAIVCVDENNNPANGNNTIITYIQTLNGGITETIIVTIPGQSLTIYDGSYDLGDTWTIISQSDEPNPSPPVAQCDLVINTINVIAESFTGAHDGKITVIASSSYGPINYSLDGITFQSSNVFSGLSGGNKNVYTTDANTIGCTANRNVFVPTNSNLLVSDPSVDLGAGNKSRWNAAFNPIVFTYQRKDYQVIAAVLNTADLNAKVSINGDMSGLTIGDYVYINAAPYIGTYQVVSFVNSNVVISTPYTTALTGTTNFININSLRPYYKIWTKIKYQDAVTGQSKTIISKNSPNATGLVETDLSTFLQSLLDPRKDNSDYTLINYRDMKLSASYQISYAEHWEITDNIDGHTSAYIDIVNPYYVTYTARQLQQLYGGNMAEFVPFKTKSAKWITDFIEPVYSKGFPFDLSFIYSEDLAGKQLYYKIELFDINRQSLGDAVLVNAFLLNEDGDFILNQDGSKFIIAQQFLGGVNISEHIGLNRLLIDYDFDPEVYFFKVGIYYQTGTAATIDFTMVENPPGPTFADGGIKILDNGVEIVYEEISRTGTKVVQAGDAIQFIGLNSGGPSESLNPKLTMTLKKNNVLVYAQTVPITPNVQLVYNVIADADALYEHRVVASDGGADVTPVNIPDTHSDDSEEIQVLADQFIRVDQNCDYNSVYLRWIGLTGSWNYYRFIFNQEHTLDVQNATMVTDYVKDWANAETIERVITKSASEKVQVHAEDMTVSEIKGCQSIKYSPMVQMCTQQSPVKWVTVILNTATFAEFESQLGAYPFAVTFNRPSINIQSQ